jgi:hypothetical protein
MQMVIAFHMSFEASLQLLRPKLSCLALRAFSDLSLVASLYLERLIGMEASIANHSRSSQARRRAGAKKNRSLSQLSIKDANKKKKLETFAVVPG